jgi:tetratricopeptide (TPR) repeat protein
MHFARFILMAGLGAALIFAQAKQPKVKTPKEGEALMAIQNAQDPDTRLKAIDNLLVKFKDTEFKVIVLEMAADTARAKNDPETMIIYCERTLEADPKNIAALSMLAKVLAERTRENDLDKDDKLKQADDYAKKCLEFAKTTEPNPFLPADQWALRKKTIEGEAHEALAASALLRKKYDEALEHLKTAVSLTEDSTTMLRLGIAYNKAGKHEDAVTILDKVMALPDAPAAVKQLASQEKVNARLALAQKKNAAAPPNPAPAPVKQ